MLLYAFLGTLHHFLPRLLQITSAASKSPNKFGFDTDSVLILTMGSQFYSKFASHLPLENCKDSFVCMGDCGGTAFEGG